MDTVLTGLPTTITGWVSSIAVLVLGIFALINIFDKGRRERSKLMSDETEKLIEIMKERISALESRVVAAEKNASDAQLNSAATIAENKTLRDILQGRDANSLELQKQALVAMKQIEVVEKAVIEQNKVLKEQQDDIKRMAKNTERLATSIEEIVKQDRQPSTKSVTIKT